MPAKTIVISETEHTSVEAELVIDCIRTNSNSVSLYSYKMNNGNKKYVEEVFLTYDQLKSLYEKAKEFFE